MGTSHDRTHILSFQATLKLTKLPLLGDQMPHEGRF